MAKNIPQWLDIELLEKILKKHEDSDTIRVVGINSKPVNEEGDNYLGDIFRLNIEYTKKYNSMKIVKKRSFIAKIIHVDQGVPQEMVEQGNIVDVEINMMTSTLIEMEKLLGDTELFGKCLYSQKNPPAIIMEDLTESDFRLTDKQAGLDFQHSLLAIKNLAKFHASSVAVVEKDPNCKKIYNKGLFFNTNGMKTWKKFHTDRMESLATAVASWPDLGPKYQEKLLKMSKNFYDLIAEKTKLNENEFNVINHGDFWINNMLFHYNKDKKVDGHIFIDFQCCTYKSPALDLHYFLYGNLIENVFINHMDQLLEQYLYVLTTTMKKIGCKTLPPSMDYLKTLLHKYEIYGVVVCCVLLPDWIMDDEDSKIHGNFIEEYSPRFMERISRHLRIWDEQGLLDI